MIDSLKLNYKFLNVNRLEVRRGGDYGYILGTIILSSDASSSKDDNKAMFLNDKCREISPDELVEIAEVTRNLGRIKAELVGESTTLVELYSKRMQNFIDALTPKKE
jgi:hypothetical protein